MRLDLGVGTPAAEHCMSKVCIMPQPSRPLVCIGSSGTVKMVSAAQDDPIRRSRCLLFPTAHVSVDPLLLL